ncbi:MAG: hypothetical protein H7A21_09385 [Spirochaetales bacterium]|nr:hypothetical protein [Leptospiraceae bacterium]MCP5481633.1 hypothetical protein [Spirochaetales bacterium]MCP5484461.1 hypothetical protein [Spirochaetales bacterium]
MKAQRVEKLVVSLAVVLVGSGLVGFVALQILPGGAALVFRLLLLLVCGVLLVLVWRWWPAASGTIGAVGFTLLAIGLCFYWLESYPLKHGQFDAWANWNLKGKLFSLSFLQSRPFSIYVGQFSHQGYPLLHPTSLAALAVALGKWSERIPAICAALYYVGTGLLVLLATQRLHIAARLVLLVGCLLLPPLVRLFAIQYADGPLAFSLALAVYLISRPESDRLPVLAGIACLFLPMMYKNEGLFLSMAMIPWAIITISRDNPKIKRAAVVVGATAMVLALSFAMVGKIVSGSGDEYGITFPLILDRISSSFRYYVLLENLVRFHLIGAAGLPFVLLAIMIRDVRFRWAGLGLLLGFGTYHGILLIAHEDINWHCVTAYDRITFHIYPAMLVLAGRLVPVEDNP